MIRRLVQSVAVLAVSAASVVGVLGLAAPASAQMRMGMGGGGGDMFGPGITTRELDKFVSMLKLTSEQQEAAKTLHTAYQEEHAGAVKAMQDTLKATQQEFMESQDPSVWSKEFPAQMKKHQEKIKTLDKGFLDDLKALLDTKQAELWPKVERAHHRDKALPAGMLAGESVNLITIVDDLKLGDNRPKELDDQIESYEIDLDRAMAERDTKREELQKKQEDTMKDGFDFSKIDFAEIRKTMAEYRKAGIKVRDVNERHARSLAGVLPADKQSDFNERVRKATFPQVYKEPYPAKALKAAVDFSDLSSEQKASLTQIQETYQREVTAANDKWSAAVSEEEKDGGGDPFGGFGKMIPGGGGDDKSPVDEARKARRDLDKQTMSKLKEILNEDQQSRLPKREDDNQFMMFGGGGGGGDAEPAKEAPPKARKKN